MNHHVLAAVGMSMVINRTQMLMGKQGRRLERRLQGLFTCRLQKSKGYERQHITLITVIDEHG